MTDYLKELPEKQVAAWYARLAKRMAMEKVNGAPALAPIFLAHWLENRDEKSVFSFKPPAHLMSSKYVTDVLQDHQKIFLSQKETAAGIIQGAVTRLRTGSWNLASQLPLNYHSLVSVGDSLVDLIRIQSKGTPAERDLLTSLRGFQLHSDVEIKGALISEKPRKVSARIVQWKAYVTDRYDWNYKEYFTVPNPDFGNNSPGSVRPMDQKLTVYHTNAERLEKAKLAAPYDIKSEPWMVSGAVLDTAVATLEP